MESHFRTIEYNASRYGMQINKEKTKMLCISACSSYIPVTYFCSTDGSCIGCTNSMRVLGFTFSGEPNVKKHLGVLQSKLKCRLWALCHLRKNGFKQSDLVLVYTSMIRPLAEYCLSVFYSMITVSDSLQLEHIQMQALKSIYGWKNSYSSLLKMSGLDRLDSRRENAFFELAKNLSENPRFNSWFPKRLASREGLRQMDVYKLYPSHTERYLKSPLNRMRRKLNELLRT